MDPISSTDRLVLLLRQKLQERAKASGAGRSGQKDRPATSTPADPTGLQAIAAVESADDRTLRRAFLQHLLAEQFGDGLINDAQFQHIVQRVADAIEDDGNASRLLSRLIADLRAM
jgi:hypothetical protein